MFVDFGRGYVEVFEDDDVLEAEELEPRYDVVGIREDGCTMTFAENLSYFSASLYLDAEGYAYAVGPEGNLNTWELEIIERWD